MEINVVLVYFLKDLMLTAIKSNIVEPYLRVEIDEFAIYLQLELCANTVSIEFDCNALIEQIINILRMDKVKLHYVNMDIKTFREIMIKYGHENGFVLEKKARKESIDIILSAFCKTLNARMWHFSFELYNLTRLEWEKKRINLIYPEIQDAELQQQIDQKTEEWNTNQMIEFPFYREFIDQLEYEACVQEIENSKVLARLSTWIANIRNRMISPFWLCNTDING